MDVVDFDPEKWSRANPCDSRADVAKVATVAKVGTVFPELSQFPQLSQVAPLPESIRVGIARLRNLRGSLTHRADRWPRVVTDAINIVESGWAARAIALSWTELDLFGAVIDPDGDPFADGLAVKLAGRQILALCAQFATVDDGNGDRFFLRRVHDNGAVLLWDLGR